MNDYSASLALDCRRRSSLVQYAERPQPGARTNVLTSISLPVFRLETQLWTRFVLRSLTMKG